MGNTERTTSQSATEERIVIVHPDVGIYIGSALGLGFFTGLDCGGQDKVCTFPSEHEAREFISGWSDNNNPDMYSFHKVAPIQGTYVGYEELASAGLAREALPLKMMPDTHFDT